MNRALEGAHLFLQASQVFPKSPAPPVRVIPPQAPIQNPNADLISAMVYQSVKTNLVFLDSALMIIKWSISLSEKIPLKHLTTSLAVIRVAHIMHGFYCWQTDDDLTEEEKSNLANDLLANSVDVAIYALYLLNINQSSLIGQLTPLALMSIDVMTRTRSIWTETFVEFWDNHPNLKDDVTKTLLYSLHFVITSVFTYSLYRAGTMLVKGSFAIDEQSISKACTLFCGILTSAYTLFYVLREFVFDDPHREAKAKTAASLIGLTLSLIAMKFGFPNSLSTYKAFLPQLKLASIAFVSFVVARVCMKVIAHFIRENDAKRQLQEWTCSFVISGLMTAFLAPRLKVVEYTSRLWLSVLQISLLAAGVFILVEAWYVGLKKLVLTVPPGDSLGVSWREGLDKMKNLI